MPPVVSGEKAREMMVNDVRPGNRPAHKGGVFADIGVFDPMDDSGQTSGRQPLTLPSLRMANVRCALLRFRFRIGRLVGSGYMPGLQPLLQAKLSY